MAAGEQKSAARKPRQASRKGAARAAEAMLVMKPARVDPETGVLPLARGYFALHDKPLFRGKVRT